MAPLFEHDGVQLWMPEAGGRVDYTSEHDEHAMTVLGLSSKREVTRTSIRVRTAMAVHVREQGRYLGGRPPYGYRWAMAGRTRTKRTPPGAAAPAVWSLIPRRRISCGGSSLSGSPAIPWHGSRGR
jgi:DNA invertase Pin-like site-specific DNA recombinase